jgi:hypothetical protein
MKERHVFRKFRMSFIGSHSLVLKVQVHEIGQSYSILPHAQCNLKLIGYDDNVTHTLANAFAHRRANITSHIRRLASQGYTKPNQITLFIRVQQEDGQKFFKSSKIPTLTFQRNSLISNGLFHEIILL